MRLLLAVLVSLSALAQESNRIDLVGAEIFGVDTAHSHLGFTIGFLGMTKVHGIFRAYRASILYDDAHPERSSVTVIIDPASIDTGEEERDKDLQGEAFFDVAKHPKIVFRSTSIAHTRGDEYVMRGELTMKGVTRAIEIPMKRTVRRGADPAWGNIRIGGAGKTTLRRKDFNITGTKFWGEMVLSDEVTVEIDLLGNRPNYDRWNLEPAAQALWTSEAAPAQYRELPAGQLNIVIQRFMQRHRFADALELLAIAREAFPAEPGFSARAGEAYASLGQREDAVRMYERALELLPDYPEALEMLGRLRSHAVAR